MSVVKPQPKATDPCPACDGALAGVPEPTDAQRAAAADRDNQTPLPPTVDSASKDFRAEHGALFRCRSCGYQTRIVPAAPVSDDPKPKAKGKAKGDSDAGGDAADA